MIFFRTFFSVIIMSMIMTICGPVIGRVGAGLHGSDGGLLKFLFLGVLHLDQPLEDELHHGLPVELTVCRAVQQMGG